MEIDTKGYGQRIKQIRKEKKLSLEAFGELLDPPAPKSLVWNWERERNLPKKDRLKQIAEIGDVSETFLKYGIKNLEYDNLFGEFSSQINIENKLKELPDSTKKIFEEIAYHNFMVIEVQQELNELSESGYDIDEDNFNFYYDTIDQAPSDSIEKAEKIRLNELLTKKKSHILQLKKLYDEVQHENYKLN